MPNLWVGQHRMGVHKIVKATYGSDGKLKTVEAARLRVEHPDGTVETYEDCGLEVEEYLGLKVTGIPMEIADRAVCALLNDEAQVLFRLALSIVTTITAFDSVDAPPPTTHPPSKTYVLGRVLDIRHDQTLQDLLRENTEES